MIYEYADTSTQGCAVTEGFGPSGGGVGGGYSPRQKRRTGPKDPVQEVKDFLKDNAAKVKPSDGVAFEVKQRRQSGVGNFRDTFIELALIVDKAMVSTIKHSCCIIFISSLCLDMLVIGESRHEQYYYCGW